MPSVGCMALVPTPAMSFSFFNRFRLACYVELAPFSYILLYIQSSERQNYRDKSGLRAGLTFSSGVVLYTNTKVLKYAKF
jgi:hypothetical protein